MPTSARKIPKHTGKPRADAGIGPYDIPERLEKKNNNSFPAPIFSEKWGQNIL